MKGFDGADDSGRRVLLRRCDHLQVVSPVLCPVLVHTNWQDDIPRFLIRSHGAGGRFFAKLDEATFERISDL